MIANSILLQTHVLVNIYDMDRAMEIMSRSSDQESFDRALIRVKNELDDNVFQYLRFVICSASIPQDDVPQAAVSLHERLPHQNRESNKSVFVCGREGCSNKNNGSLKLCSGCKLVGYCSKDCQKASWKEHRKSCKPKSTDSKKITASAKAARRAPDPALLTQDFLLAENPGEDYIIVFPDDNDDTGVQIICDPMEKLQFKFCRQIL